MKGGYIHERLLLDRIERLFRERGFEVQKQVGTTKGMCARYADLVVNIGPHRLVVEAETSSTRVKGDLEKASEMSATWLWIVVPNRKVADSVRKQLRILNVRETEPWLSILTLGQAIERVTNCYSLFPFSKRWGKTNKHTQGGGIK